MTEGMVPASLIDAAASATRRLPAADAQPVCFDFGMVPESGDAVAAKVVELGHHKRLEVILGREVPLRPGMVCTLETPLTDIGTSPHEGNKGCIHRGTRSRRAAALPSGPHGDHPDFHFRQQRPVLVDDEGEDVGHDDHVINRESVRRARTQVLISPDFFSAAAPTAGG